MIGPSALLDRGILRDWAEYHGAGGTLLASGLIDLFLGTAPADFHRLGQALGLGDRAAVNLLSHSLKSSCTNVGAIPAAKLFEKIERAGPDVDTAARLYLELTGLFEATVEELRSFRADLVTAA